MLRLRAIIKHNLLFALFAVSLNVNADVETVDGITWRYTVCRGEASVGNGYSCAIPSTTKGAITLPPVLGGFPVTSISSWAFYNCKGLTSVSIHKGVKRIGDRAFWGCNKLCSVTIPPSVNTIEWGAFMDCGELTSVNIPDGLVQVADSVFKNCTALTTVTIPTSVTNVCDDAFHGCSALSSVSLPEGVSTIGQYAFCGCSALSSLVIPPSVTEIGYGAFGGCSNLGYGLVIVDNCVLAITGPVSTYISIPQGVRLVADGAFAYNTWITTLLLPESVEHIGSSAFLGCRGLADVEGFVIVRGVLYDYVGNATEVSIPDSVLSIGARAFEYCDGITSVSIPSSVKSIGYNAFSGCTALKSVSIPDGVTSIGDGAFKDCSGLTSITIPSSMADVGNGAFQGCSGLTLVTIPSGVIRIGDGAFDYCSSLLTIDVADANSAYSSFEGVLYNKTRTNLIRCPESKTGAVTIATSTMKIADCAFYCCSGLTSIMMPHGVTTIGALAFAGSGLTTVEIPSSVTSIGDDAFGWCRSLIAFSVAADNAVFCSFEGILYDKGMNALLKCPASKNGVVSVPANVKSINDEAFFECAGLSSVARASFQCNSTDFRVSA